MYLDHWKLVQPPFEARPDSRYLFAAAQHAEALAAISYAACSAGEPVLLTGPAGCGKSLLLRALRRQLPREHYRVAFVPEVCCATAGLLARVAYHLAHNAVPNASAAMEAIAQQARALQPADGLVVLLDDWPAHAAPELLAELRWLLTLDIDQGRVCALLAGEDIVPQRDWPAWLAQRLLTTAHVGPLEPAQVPEYLAQRLRVAAAGETGPATAGQIFTPEAAAMIAEWSGCVPRLINRLAHLALHVVALERGTVVNAEAVQRAAARLVQVPAGAAQPCAVSVYNPAGER